MSCIFYAQNRVTIGHYVLLSTQPLVPGAKSEAMEVGRIYFLERKENFLNFILGKEEKSYHIICEKQKKENF